MGDERKRELERKAKQGDVAAQVALARDGCRTGGHDVSHMLNYETAIHLALSLRCNFQGVERMHVTCAGCQTVLYTIDPKRPVDMSGLFDLVFRTIEDHARGKGLEIAKDEDRCLMQCPHGDRCRLEHGHLQEPSHPGEHPSQWGCSMVWCDCNESMVRRVDALAEERRRSTPATLKAGVWWSEEAFNRMVARVCQRLGILRTEDSCASCGGALVFSARMRGASLCGPCWRYATNREEAPDHEVASRVSNLTLQLREGVLCQECTHHTCGSCSAPAACVCPNEQHFTMPTTAT